MKYPAVNRLFTFACFSVSPIAGSLVSFLWHGGALWCTFEVATRRQRLSDDRDMRNIALLLYLYAGATLLSYLINGPSTDTIGRIIPLATFLLFPFSYSVWSISEKSAVREAAIFGSMAASYGAALFALVEHFVLHTRPEGGAGNALVFALVSCMAGAVCLSAALIQETRWRAALFGGYAASVLTVLLSESRSVWVAMAVLLVVNLIVFRRRLQQIFRGSLIYAAAAFLMIAIAASGVLIDRFKQLEADWTVLSEQGDYNSSTGLRLAMWEIGARHFLARPLLGNGPQNTRAIIRENLAENFGIGRSFTHFHNGFLTLLVESGILGGGAVIAVFLLAAWMALRNLRAASDENARFGAMLLLTLVVTYGVSGSVNIVLGHDIIDTVFMVSLIVGTYLASGESMLEKRRRAGLREPQ